MMGLEQEKNALRAVRTETENLSELAKTFFAAVSRDPRVQRKEELRRLIPDPPRLLKPVGT